MKGKQVTIKEYEQVTKVELTAEEMSKFSYYFDTFDRGEKDTKLIDLP